MDYSAFIWDMGGGGAGAKESFRCPRGVLGCPPGHRKCQRQELGGVLSCSTFLGARPALSAAGDGAGRGTLELRGQVNPEAGKNTEVVHWCFFLLPPLFRWKQTVQKEM